MRFKTNYLLGMPLPIPCLDVFEGQEFVILKLSTSFTGKLTSCQLEKISIYSSLAYFTLEGKKLTTIYAKSKFQFVSAISWIGMAEQLPSFDAEIAFAPYFVNTPVRTAFSLIFNLQDDRAQIIYKQWIRVLFGTAIGGS